MIRKIGLAVVLTLLSQTARAENVTCWKMSANEQLPPPVRVEATAKGEFEVMWPTHGRIKEGKKRACIWIESHTLASGKRSLTSTVATTDRYLVHVKESDELRKLFSRTASVSLRMRLEDRHGTLRIALFRQPVKKTAKALACARKDFSGLDAVARKKAYAFEESVCARIVSYDGEELTPPEILNDKSHADRLIARAKDYLQAAYIEVAAPGEERGRYPLGFENKDPCSFIMSTATVSKAASDLALEIQSSNHADARDKSIFLRTAFEIPEAVQTCWSFVDTPVGPWVQDVETSPCEEKGSNERCRRVPLSRIVGSDGEERPWLYELTDEHIRRYIGVTPPGRYVGQVRVGGAPPRRFQIDIPPERSLLQTSLYLGILLSIGLGGFVALRIAIFQASRRIRNLADQTRRARTEMVECGGLRFDVFDRAEVAASVARSSSHPSAEERFRDHLSWLDSLPPLKRVRRAFTILIAKAPFVPPLVATGAALVIWVQWKTSILPDSLITFAAVGLRTRSGIN
ncbi:MAG: hypothetical protein RIT81_34990 [Deltaproteobacteria bacterium]